jgi:hypothetical protein
MPTNFGMKSRPYLQIVDWRQPLGPDSAPALPTPPAQLPPATAVDAPASTVEAMAPVKPIPIEEFIDDEIPF